MQLPKPNCPSNVQVVQIEYIPPDTMTLKHFTDELCNALTKQGHSKFESKASRWQVLNLLSLIAELTTKQLNTSNTDS
jgi:hypothetical protein